MLRKIAISVALILYALPALAGVKEGALAYKHGDFKMALAEFKPLAEKGNALAQYNLGRMYYLADGMPQNLKKAFDWFQKAANKGIAEAQFCLGLIYFGGTGAPVDYVQSYKWYAISAINGYAKGNKYKNITAYYMSHEQILKAQKLAKEWKHD